MTTPMDDNPSALQQAVSALQRKRAFKREMAKAEPAIRSGLCSHCGAFGSLWHQTDSCEECFRLHEAPQPVTFVYKDQPVNDRAQICSSPCKYCGGTIYGYPYYASFIGEQGHHACETCYRAGKVKPGNGKPLTEWAALDAKARSTFANAAWMVTIWLLAMTGLCFIGWYAMRAVGEFCFWLGGKL